MLSGPKLNGRLGYFLLFLSVRVRGKGEGVRAGGGGGSVFFEKSGWGGLDGRKRAF